MTQHPTVPCVQGRRHPKGSTEGLQKQSGVNDSSGAAALAEVRGRGAWSGAMPCGASVWAGGKHAGCSPERVVSSLALSQGSHGVLRIPADQ